MTKEQEDIVLEVGTKTIEIVGFQREIINLHKRIEDTLSHSIHILLKGIAHD